MYIVKDDNPDVGFEIEAPIVTDAEGNELPATEMVFNTSSSDPAVVEVQIPDPVDPQHGAVHFGKPGNAAITVNVLTKAGVLLGSFGAQFTVTVGDPASIVGGKITFAGLTEV